MSRLRIRHTTGFTYAGDVVASYNEARMLPASSDGQLVLFSNLDIRPVTSVHAYTDYWGPASRRSMCSTRTVSSR